MSIRELLVVFAAFAVGAAGLFGIVRSGSSTLQAECERHCSVSGQRAVSAPAGTTTGQSIDNSNPRDGSNCLCAPK